MRVLLTGATGFLGGWVVAGLTACGVDVATFPGRLLATPDRDVEGALRRSLGDVDVVCHLASATPLQPGPPRRATYTPANVESTRLLLDTAGAGRHVVLASTAMISGLPAPPDQPDSDRGAYAVSKLAAERVVEAYAGSGSGGSGTSLRFNAMGGPGNDPARGVIAAALDAALRGTPFRVLGGGDAGRDYLHVYDAARAVVAAVHHHPADGFQTVEIGSGRLSTTEDVLAAAERVTRRPIRRAPAARRSDVADRPACDLRAAQAVLGWAPVRSDLETIVRDQWAGRSVPGTSVAPFDWNTSPG